MRWAEPGEASPEQQRGGSAGTSPGSRPREARQVPRPWRGRFAAACRSRSLQQGRVTVDGEVVTDPARDVGEGDEVRVDGGLVGAEAREVWAVNKPAGRRLDRARSPDRGRRWSSWSTARPASTRSAGSTPTRPACCCSPTTASSPTASPTRATESTKAYRARLAAPTGRRRPAAPRRGCRARGRPDRAGGGAAPGRARDRDRPARGPQPPGAADGRGGRQPGGRPAPGPLRPARARRSGRGQGPPPHRRGDRRGSGKMPRP